MSLFSLYTRKFPDWKGTYLTQAIKKESLCLHSPVD